MREITDLVEHKGEILCGLTFDATNFSNYKSYISSYEIPENEQVLVYAGGLDSSDGSLTGAGPIITDEAIYLHPSRQHYTKVGRIPLSEICTYLVYETGEKGVNLLGSERELQIFVHTRADKSSTAASLVSLLHMLQKSMMVKSTDKTTYIRTLKHACSLVRQEMHTAGVLGEDFKSILSVVETFPEFRREAVFLQLEDMYRRGDSAAYDAFLENKKSFLHEDNLKVLKNPDTVFSGAYISDLADTEAFSDVRAIIDAYLSLKNKRSFTKEQAKILLYLCVRMQDFQYFNEIIAKVGDSIGSEDLWTVMNFAAVYKNKRLNAAAAKAAGFEDLGKEDVMTTNDLGFCLLHYVLILRNKEVIRHVLSGCDWSRYQAPELKDKMCEIMYDPLFVASYIFKDESLLRDVFIYTSPKAKSLNRSIKGIDSMIDINTKLRRKYPEHKKEYNNKLEEYRSMRKDMRAELKKMAKDEVKRYRKLQGIIREAKHPFCEYLFAIYSSFVLFLDSLSCTKDVYRLYKYKQLFFVANPNIDLDLSFVEYKAGAKHISNIKENDTGYFGKAFTNPDSIFENPVFKRAMEEEMRKAKEKERRRREFHERVRDPQPYVGSWFSRAAHESIKELKDEYRILVKKYHPDSSGDSRTAGMLMRIMSERADILENLSRQGQKA